MTSHSSSNLMNYVEFTVVITASVAKKDVLKTWALIHGEVTKEMAEHVRIRRGNVNVHRDQGIMERFN